MPPLLSPCNDLVFKLIFSRSPHLLSDLINALRSGLPPIQVVEVLNPQVTAEDVESKYIVLDVLARDGNGQYFNVELQMRRQEYWGLRGIYYLSKIYAGQLKQGQAYDVLKPVIGIHLLGHTLFPEYPEKAQWRFILRDEELPQVSLGQELEWNLLELPKARKMISEAVLSGTAPQSWPSLLNWIIYLEQDQRAMNDLTYPPVLEALEKLKGLSADEGTRQLAEKRERALMEERAALHYARAEGRTEGLVEGEAIGEARGEARGRAGALREAVEKMVASGISETQARTILGLPPEE